MKKILSITLAVGMMAMTISPAIGVTIEELQAQIAALMAQLQALQGAQGAGYSFTRDLTVGSRGDDVTALQNYLTTTGHFTYSGATGYFGPITKAAVAAWQTANAVSPTAGYFGPISRAKYVALVGTATPTPTPTPTPGETPTPTPTVEPTEGSIELKLNPSPANLTEVNLGAGIKSVMGFDVKAKSSDITIKRIDVQFGNRRPSQFFTHVGLYEGDTAIAGITPTTANTFEYTTTNFGIRFDNLAFVVAKDTTKVITVKVSMPSSIIGIIADTNIVVTVPNSNGIRFTDTSGLSHETGSALTTRTFIAKVAGTGTVELALNANTPVERVAQTSDTAQTEGIEALRFNLKAKTQSSTLKAFQVGLTDSASIVSGLRLYDGDTLLASVAASGSGSYDFTDLTVALTKDVDKTLMVKIDTIATTAFGTAVVTANTAAVTGEDSNYTTISGNTGTATGKTVHLYNKAPQITLNGTTAFAYTPTDQTKIASNGAIKVNVTALGGDIFVATSTGAIATRGLQATSSIASTIDQAFNMTHISGATLGTWGWQIPNGATAVFEVAMTLNNTGGASAGYKDAWLYGLRWSTADSVTDAVTWTNVLGLGSSALIGSATLKATPVYLTQ